MACNAADIPHLSFPRNEIIEIMPASYHNEATRIFIPDLPEDLIPGSPQDIQIPVASDGSVTPMTNVGSPVEGARSPKHASGTQSPKNAGDGGPSSLVARTLGKS